MEYISEEVMGGRADVVTGNPSVYLLGFGL